MADTTATCYVVNSSPFPLVVSTPASAGKDWKGGAVASGIQILPGDTQAIGAMGEPGIWHDDATGWVYVDLQAGGAPLELQIYAYVSAGEPHFLQGWIGPKAANSTSQNPMPAGAWSPAVLTSTKDGHTLTYTLTLDAPFPPYIGKLVEFVPGESWSLSDTVPSVRVVGTPAVGMRGAATIACARALDGSLYVFWKASASEPWVVSPMSGPNGPMPPVAGDPAMLVASDGSVNVVARGTQNQLYHFWLPPAATAGQWVLDNITGDTNAEIDGNPAFVCEPASDDALIIVARGFPEKHLVCFALPQASTGTYAVTDVSVNASPSAPMAIAGDPVMFAASDGSVTVYVQSAQSDLLLYSCALPNPPLPQQAQWSLSNVSTAVGGQQIAGAPGLTSDATHVYASGSQGQLLAFYPGPPWSQAPLALGSGGFQVTGNPVVVTQAGALTVFVRGSDTGRGTDSQLLVGTTGWDPTKPTSGPLAVTNASWEAGGTAVGGDPAILANGGAVSVFAVALPNP